MHVLTFIAGRTQNRYTNMILDYQKENLRKKVRPSNFEKYAYYLGVHIYYTIMVTIYF